MPDDEALFVSPLREPSQFIPTSRFVPTRDRLGSMHARASVYPSRFSAVGRATRIEGRKEEDGRRKCFSPSSFSSFSSSSWNSVVRAAGARRCTPTSLHDSFVSLRRTLMPFRVLALSRHLRRRRRLKAR